MEGTVRDLRKRYIAQTEAIIAELERTRDQISRRIDEHRWHLTREKANLARTTCAECGQPITETECARLALDTDFVPHGDTGHFIRIVMPS